MKLNLLFFTIILFAITTRAQVTITNADVVHIGDTIKLATSLDTTLTPLFNMPNSTWNFASLTADTERIWVVKNPANTPYAATFNAATMALESGSSYQFVSANANALSANGAVVNNPYSASTVVIKFNTPENVLQFPASINGAFNTAADYSFVVDTNISFPYTLFGIPVTVSVDKIKLSGHRKHVVNNDAQGTIVTPLGTFNALRVKDYLIETDSIYANIISPPIGYIALPANTIPNVSNPMVDTSTTYTWYANNVGYKLLSFNYDSASNSSFNVEWLKNLTIASGIAEINNSAISIFPNPSHGQLNINTNNYKLKTIRVFSSTGNLVKEIMVSQNKTTYDFIGLNSGLYYFDMLDAEGISIKKEKIVIVK